jgi:hypothetical protein
MFLCLKYTEFSGWISENVSVLTVWVCLRGDFELEYSAQSFQIWGLRVPKEISGSQNVEVTGDGEAFVISLIFVRFQVLTAASLDDAPYILVEIDRRLRGANCLRHNMIAVILEAASAFETSVSCYQTTRRNSPGDSHLCYFSVLQKYYCSNRCMCFNNLRSCRTSRSYAECCPCLASFHGRDVGIIETYAYWNSR